MPCVPRRQERKEGGREERRGYMRWVERSSKRSAAIARKSMCELASSGTLLFSTHVCLVRQLSAASLPSLLRSTRCDSRHSTACACATSYTSHLDTSYSSLDSCCASRLVLSCAIPSPPMPCRELLLLCRELGPRRSHTAATPRTCTTTVFCPRASFQLLTQVVCLKGSVAQKSTPRLSEWLKGS